MPTLTHNPNDEILEWRSRSPRVRKALAYIKRRGSITAEDLVEWDRTHGKQLFNWDDASAAEDWRRHQARIFLNSFRTYFEKMRVRGFIHVRKDEEADINEAAYVSVETITQHRGMRVQVIADIIRRIEMLTSELRMWKLTQTERTQFFERLAAVLEEKEVITTTEKATRRPDLHPGT